MLQLLQACSCNDGGENQLPCFCQYWKYVACRTHTLSHSPSKPECPSNAGSSSVICFTYLCHNPSNFLAVNTLSTIVGIKSQQLHSCLLQLKGYSMWWPNDIPSFSSDCEVYVNNISMVYDCHNSTYELLWPLSLTMLLNGHGFVYPRDAAILSLARWYNTILTRQ